MRRQLVFLFASLCAGCASTSYITPDTVTQYDSKFSDTDLKMVSDKMAQSLRESAVMQSREKTVIGLLHVKNRTSEHINTDAVTDKMMIALLKTGEIKFAGRENLKTLIEEQRLSQTGMVDQDKVQEIGKLYGIDFFISGQLESIEKKGAASELTYYRLSLSLTDTETSEIVWADEVELKKKSSKHIMDW